MVTVEQLKKDAKDKEIKGYYKMNKSQLCAALKKVGVVYDNCEAKAKKGKEKSPKGNKSPKGKEKSPKGKEKSPEKHYYNGHLIEEIIKENERYTGYYVRMGVVLGMKFYYHSINDKPAYSAEWEDGTKNYKWYKEGKLHREGDKPAIIDTDDIVTHEKYYIEGYPYREEDKPDSVWYENDKIIKSEWHDGKYLHREEDKPAVIEEFPDGRILYKWYEYGDLHREGNPAVMVYLNGVEILEERQWWDHGMEVSEDEYSEDEGEEEEYSDDEGEESELRKMFPFEPTEVEETDNEELQCPVCLSNKKTHALLKCGHTFCSDCVKELDDETGRCGTCRKPIEGFLRIY